MDTGGELNVAMRSFSFDLYADFDSCHIPHDMRWTNGIDFSDHRSAGKLLADPIASTIGKSFGSMNEEG